MLVWFLVEILRVLELERVLFHVRVHRFALQVVLAVVVMVDQIVDDVLLLRVPAHVLTPRVLVQRRPRICQFSLFGRVFR